MIAPVGVVLALSAVLFGIGVFGFLARRNLILMIVSIEVMLNAVNVSLAGFSQHLGDTTGQVLALFLHVAGIFLLLGAEFLAAVQVIVYAGAILIFYLFVVMLLDLPGEEAGPRFGAHWPWPGSPWSGPSHRLQRVAQAKVHLWGASGT